MSASGLRFIKMHGIGNDYVFVNLFEDTVADPPSLAQTVSDRHFGVGADGLVLIGPSDAADVSMRIFNADGSEAEMCGNGIRCVAKFSRENGLAEGDDVAVETQAGVKTIRVFMDGDRVTSARVDMGLPGLRRADIPMTGKPNERCVDEPLGIPDVSHRATCVSMGNPHAVVFVPDVEAADIERIGPMIENAADVFPQRINVHVVQTLSRGEVRMRTWERGSGLTLACGTGASAVCVAGALTDRTGRSITAHLPGGDLQLEWADDDRVFMTGPAAEAFRGEWPAA